MVTDQRSESDSFRMLNLGCGTDTSGIGIDINYPQADIRADLNEGIPARSNSVDEILAEHVLEHVENPSRLLRECRRVLRPGGEIHLEVPNAGWLPVRLYITQDIQRFWEHKIPGERGHWLARVLGNPDPERTPHLSFWTKELLAQQLRRAGFEYRFIDTHHLSRNLRTCAWISES